MAHYGPEEWFYANGVLAANQRAAVFGPGNDNTYAPIFSDPGMTVPLANPTTTNASGLLEFYAPDGQYWVFVGPEATGDSVLVTLGVSPDNPVLSVNGIAPDGAGNVEVTAADVGAQPISTINAAGDLYIGTGNDATTRLPIGAPGEVLTVVAGTASWEPGGGGAVDSVNGQTGVVVLDSTDVGAQPIATIDAAGDLYVGTGPDATTRLPIGSAGEVLTVVAGLPSWEPGGGGAVDSVNGQTGVVVLTASDVGAQPIATIDAAGDLYVGTGPDATTRLPIGSAGEILTVVAGTPSWEPAPAGGVTSVNGETGDVVLDATDVGAVPVSTAENIVYGTTTGGAPLNREISTIASPDTVLWRTGESQARADTVADANPAADPDDLTNRAYVAAAISTAGAGYVPTSRTITTQNGLTGGGDLSANRTIEPVYGTGANQVAQGNDTRIVNAIQGTLLDAKGDIIAATADNTPARVPVGSNTQVLMANSAATPGVEWHTLVASDVGAIATSLIDAKGDLIVGTANDTAARQAVGSNSQVLSANSGVTNGVEWRTLTTDVTVEFVDDRPVLTTGNGQARWYNRAGAGTIVGAWVSAGVVPTGADIIVDVNLNGTTIFTTQANRPTVPATTNGGAISATPDVTALANGDYFTVDIDQIGSTIAGGRITVGIVVRRTL